MPYPNEHAARLIDPDSLDPKRVARTHGSGDGMVQGVKIPDSIDVIWFIIEREDGGEAPVAQALRFPVRRWTEKEARDWLKEHKIKFILFEPATEEEKNQKKRGSEMKIIKGLVKAIDESKKTIEAFVSTFEHDRMDERFDGEWKLDNYLKNPVVLWGHNHSLPPIGKAIDIGVHEINGKKGLYAKTQFDEKGELAMDIFRLFKEGFLNAFSVGFMGKVENDPAVEGKYIIKNPELLEYSAVSVPANPGAIISRDIANIAKKTFGENIIREKDGKLFIAENEIVKPKSDFETALKEIGELAKSVKFKPTETNKISLLKTTIATLNDILSESEPKYQASMDDIKGLQDIINAYVKSIRDFEPNIEESARKMLKQLDAAL